MSSAPGLLLRDEVHGDIEFDQFEHDVIDHPLVQRLRHIKQMGLADYVFPSATHTRFQHSLGVGYVAKQYFSALVYGWQASALDGKAQCDDSTVFFSRTKKVACDVRNSAKSYRYWTNTVCLAGLLHDVGHGPWSHTFDRLALNQDFSSATVGLNGVVKRYFEQLLASGKRLSHEDVSVLYIHRILTDLGSTPTRSDASDYFLGVASLVNKSFLNFDKPLLEQELERTVSRCGVLGGVEMHRLLRPVISGTFDSDRIDYIQRDSKNCGLSIGGIEWMRILSKVLPCLADYRVTGSEPNDVVLLSSVKNLHVLDHFVFSLFQMYAQVYMHPKIVGLEEELHRLLEQHLSHSTKLTIDFESHQRLNDASFTRQIVEDFGLKDLTALLGRRAGHRFSVANIPQALVEPDTLMAQGYVPLDVSGREMLKDKVGVFIFIKQGDPNQQGGVTVKEWDKISPVAGSLASVSYRPSYWIRRK